MLSLTLTANLNDNQACDLAVNVYARTRLRYSLEVEPSSAAVGDNISVWVVADILDRAIPTRAGRRS